MIASRALMRYIASPRVSGLHRSLPATRPGPAPPPPRAPAAPATTAGRGEPRKKDRLLRLA